MVTGILFSGGLESTALIHYYNRNVLLLYIKEGFERESAEYENALKAAKFYGVPIDSVEIKGLSPVNKKEIKSVKDNVIPIRNLFLLTIGAKYFVQKGIKRIAAGLTGGGEYPDNSIEYIKRAESLLKEGGADIKIELPFYGLEKKEIAMLFNKEINKDLIFTCATPVNGKQCGKCLKCKALKEAFNS